MSRGRFFDVVQCSQGIFTGQTARESPNSEDRPQRWANWVFSLPEVWQEDETMPDRPVIVHCSGLGGGLLSRDHEYDIFFQNHAQMKVYGPSLAMMDDWEHRVTQLGLTKFVHEYAVYQLLATAMESLADLCFGTICRSQIAPITSYSVGDCYRYPPSPQ